MADSIRLASILEESIADGPGLRFVVFAQGCPHRCRGCHNPQTFLYVGGREFTISRLLELYRKNPLIRGITFSGGEPFLQAGPLAQLARAVHAEGCDIVTYRALLTETDLLIDGPFVLARRSLEHPFVGSLNQRLIALSEKGDRLLEDIVMPLGVQPVERIRFGVGQKIV